MKLFQSRKGVLFGFFALGAVIIGGIQCVFGWNLFGSNEYTKTLAGESIPFDKTHQFNIERFDRELAINMMNESQMMMSWKRFPLFRPMIEKKLREAGLPKDIFYLAIAESALRDTAVSTAGAAGLWQFMPATAKGYGLRVDEFIDERYDVEKSTDAAIQYLSKAYSKFGNWALAMASYNRGISGISNDMVSQYQNSYYDLWLNSETSRYIFRIAALKEIYENLSKYFNVSKWGAQYAIPNTSVIQIGATENLAVWAAANGYSYAEIRWLNPWIRKNALPEGTWSVKVYSR